MEYDPNDAIRIVEEALGMIENTSKREALSFTDLSAMELLPDILKKYIPHHQDVALAISDIREGILDRFSEDHSPEGIRGLHTAVSNCMKCPRVIKGASLPSWNTVNPDVLFILDTPLKDRDTHFISALKDSGFRSSRVCATSVVRCDMPQGEKFTSEEVGNCSSNFLFEEIKLMRPKLVVTLGKTAASILLGKDVNLKDERGIIFWLGIWQVLPSISPRQIEFKPSLYDDLVGDFKLAYHTVYGN